MFNFNICFSRMSCDQEYKKVQQLIKTLNDSKAEVDEILDLCGECFVIVNLVMNYTYS